VEAWLPGEQGGTAVADILFGDVNPSGRLAITVPRHSGQLPAYYNYRPSKEYWIKEGWGHRRYADMSALPLWEFGYGLSYTNYEYSNLRIGEPKVHTGGDVHITADVRNAGERAGAEVAQLYIRDVISSVTTPVKQLKGFAKVVLEAGEKKTVHFTLTPDDLSLLNRQMVRVVEPGEFQVMIGHSSGDIRLTGSFEVLE
jgi:beta-glucosidase